MSATTRQKIRVLFVSGATGGGSLLSTRQLAFELRDRGYSVGFLEQTRRVDCRRRRWVHEKLRTLAVKVRPRSLSRPVVAMAGMIGSWPKPSENIDGVDCWKSAIVGNAVGRVINKLHPDVVVVASVAPQGWSRAHASAAVRGIATVRYLREEASLQSLGVAAQPDVLIANSHALVADASDRGRDATFIPSIIRLDDCIVASTRDKVLFVNPVEISGLDLVIEIARARRDLQFVFQESWVFPGEFDRLTHLVSPLDNVEVRRFTEQPSTIYRDARIVLLPYLTNGRPRVVLEAQANGIPVVGSSRPAMIETIGPGGIVVANGASALDWGRALDAVNAQYDGYCELARVHSARSEVSVPHIVDSFERAIAVACASAGR